MLGNLKPISQQLKEESIRILENNKEKNIYSNKKKRLIFFVKQGLDNFLGDIVEGLCEEYETQKIIVTEYRQIDEGMQWADICWFEWCDELIAYGSKLDLAKEKRIICRLHRYEALTDNPKNVEWENVDTLVVVTDHLKRFLISLIPDIETKVDILTVVNGLNLNKYKLKERKSGFNIAYVGYIHARKNPALLLQIINELVKKDKRYTLYLAGKFQDSLIQLYWNDQINKMGLEKNIIFQGWQEDINIWLENKNYIISTSIHESFGYGIAEAMSSGIKPVIHNFLFADEVWDKKYLFNSISEAIDMIADEEYKSKEYRYCIEQKYSLEKQIKSIKKLINGIGKETKELPDIIKYTRQMLNSKVNFENINDLTLLIPTYNRALILKNDLEKGFKLGKQSKLIVDDASDKLNNIILNNLYDEKKFGVEKIIFHSKNKGVAGTVNTGIENIKTKLTMFLGDDDIIFCNDNIDFKASLEKLNLNNTIIVPRYILNLNETGEISLGYDRKDFDSMQCANLLKYIFITGEMKALNAGAIYNTRDLKLALNEEIFKVSEDYTMLSKVLANSLNKKVIVSENYIYVRRVAINTLSKQLNVNNLSLHLISLITSGYYCLKNNLISTNELTEALKNRGQLLQNIYGYGLKFVELMIDYIEDKISIEGFINIAKQSNTLEDISLQNIPKEFIEIKQYIKKGLND